MVLRDGAQALEDVRAKHASFSRHEEIEIRTSDGWLLRADVYEPTDAVGTVVLAHAWMARRSEFSRPAGSGIARFFVDRAWRVVAFDFRGHGDSRREDTRDYGYDDL